MGTTKGLCGHAMGTLQGLYGDTKGTLWGLYGDTKGTLWGHQRDAMGTPKGLWGCCGDGVGTPEGRYGDTMGTLWGRRGVTPQEEQQRAHEEWMERAEQELLELQRNLPEKRSRGRELEEHRLHREHLQYEVGHRWGLGGAYGVRGAAFGVPGGLGGQVWGQRVHIRGPRRLEGNI